MRRHTPPSPLLFPMLSALLDYPDDALIAALQEARMQLRDERALPQEARQGLERFFDYCDERELIRLQENYVALFDRGRATSLHLFEHVHGESRDRGQAMVDLLQMYEQHGLYLNDGQLPDYLPVFLEYLSRLPADDSLPLLAETGEILQSITEQLSKRGSPYAFVIGALLPLAGIGQSVPAEQELHEDDADMIPDATHYRALDAAYADEPVRFVGAQSPMAPMSATTSSEEPIRFHERRPGS